MVYRVFLGKGKSTKNDSPMGSFDDYTPAVEAGKTALNTARQFGIRNAHVRIEHEVQDNLVAETRLSLPADPNPPVRRPRKAKVQETSI